MVDTNCRNLERQLRQIVLDYTTKVNNLICIINKQSEQIKLDCISCSTGIPVFTNVKSAFVLGTDTNGKIIVNNNIYSKSEIDNLIPQLSANLGNTNLTLTDNRSLNGNNKGLLFSNLSDFSLYSNNFVFVNPSGGAFTFSSNTGVCILDVTLLFGASKNLKLPNENGILATQSYTSTEDTNTLNSANSYTETQLNGYIKKVNYNTYASVDENGPEALLIVNNDENNSNNIGMYYRNGLGKVNWIIAQPFNY